MFYVVCIFYIKIYAVYSCASTYIYDVYLINIIYTTLILYMKLKYIYVILILYVCNKYYIQDIKFTYTTQV